jgi:hypothetical protein
MALRALTPANLQAYLSRKILLAKFRHSPASQQPYAKEKNNIKAQKTPRQISCSGGSAIVFGIRVPHDEHANRPFTPVL